MSSPLERLQSRLKKREAEKKASEPPDGSRFSVVIVDDEQPNLDALVRALNRSYDVLAFKNPEDALAHIVAGSCPDLIITDQRMPEMTGVNLLREVGKAHPHCVGFILSGFTERADLLGAINRAPVVGYVTKPWKVDELRESVELAIRISQKKQTTRHMTAKLNLLRTEIRGLKVVLKQLNDEGAELPDRRVQEVRGKMIKLRDRLGELTRSTAPAVERLTADVSRPGAAIGAVTLGAT
jgi:response regulator RpfG family c-di-GMP phosphodiesterase